MRKYLYHKESLQLAKMIGTVKAYDKRVACARRLHAASFYERFKSRREVWGLKSKLRRALKLNIISPQDFEKLEELREK